MLESFRIVYVPHKRIQNSEIEITFLPRYIIVILAKYFFLDLSFSVDFTPKYNRIVPWEICNLEASTHNISYTRSLNGKKPFTFDYIENSGVYLQKKKFFSSIWGCCLTYHRASYLRLCSHLVYPSTSARFLGTSTGLNTAFLSVPEQKSWHRARAMRYVQGYSSTWAPFLGTGTGLSRLGRFPAAFCHASLRYTIQ